MAKPTVKARDEEPTASEWGLIRAYLAQNGMSQAEIMAVVGNAVQGRKRGEICDTLRAWLKEL